MVDQRRLALDSKKKRSYLASNRIFMADVFCHEVKDRCTLSAGTDSPLFVFRDHSAPPLTGCKRGLGSAGFRWSFAGKFEHWLAAKFPLTVILHLSAGEQKTSLDVHETATCQRKCRCSRPWSLCGQRVLQWNGQTDITSSLNRT